MNPLDCPDISSEQSFGGIGFGPDISCKEIFKH